MKRQKANVAKNVSNTIILEGQEIVSGPSFFLTFLPTSVTQELCFLLLVLILNDIAPFFFDRPELPKALFLSGSP